MRLVDDQLISIDLVPATEFELLCPNWKVENNDECFVTLTRDPEFDFMKLCSHQGKCMETKVQWKLSTYRGTKFGKLCMSTEKEVPFEIVWKFCVN